MVPRWNKIWGLIKDSVGYPSHRVNRIVSDFRRSFALGFTRKLALQLGHFAFMSLIFLSLVISSQTEGTGDSVWPMNIPMAVRSLEITCKKLAITFRDSCEFYAYPETWCTFIGIEDC